MPADPRLQPAGGLLPWPVPVAMGVMAVNDHWAKTTFDNWWTGKLSDFAVLLFFPLLLQALFEGGQVAMGAYAGPSRRVLIGMTLATALAFSAVNLFEPAAHAYRVVWGVFHWVPAQLSSWVTGGGWVERGLAFFVLDRTDNITLVSLGGALALGWRRCRPRRG